MKNLFSYKKFLNEKEIKEPKEIKEETIEKSEIKEESIEKSEEKETNETFNSIVDEKEEKIEEKSEVVCDCKKDEEDCECDEEVNEGFLGKIAKVLSKKEYEKTLNHCMDNCCEDGECCSLSDIEDCIKNMIFSKITKKALDDDNKLFKSLAEEIHKDCKKKCDEKSNESVVKFGSDEWNEKYGIKVEKEEVKQSFNSLVNETLKVKKVEYTSLNEKVNNLLDNEVKTLETIKKDEKKDEE